MSDVDIPDEALTACCDEYDRARALDAQTDEHAEILGLRAAAPLIVAVEIASDEGLEVLRETAVRVDSDSDAMTLVGAVLRYVDDRRRRAAELRGEES